MKSIFSRIFPVLFFFILIVILYYPVFFQGYWAVNSSDAAHLHLPNSYLLVKSFKQGFSPLWNPYFNLGQPIIDGSTTIFHPALILYFLFQPWLAHTIEILFGLLLTFLGTWLFLRQQKFKIFPALTGTVIYVLSGPVFFLHSYHLGFMAILLLPWGLYLFHRYDKTRSFIWIWLSAFICILAVHSLDIDTLIYLYIGFIIDRIICFTKNKRKNYIITWIVIFIFTALTGAVIYLPLYEWINLSSRMNKSYTDVLFPDFSNLLTATITGQWLTNWPYEVFYFYFGPAVIWLIITGLIKSNKDTFKLRYFCYSLSLPIFFIIVYVIQIYYSTFLSSLDIWRSMFVFCLGLALISSTGVRNILQSKRICTWVSFIIGLLTFILAMWSISINMEMRTYIILLIASIGIFITILPWFKRNNIFPIFGISITLIATLVVFAIYHVSSTYYCVRYRNEITKNLSSYNRLSKVSNDKEEHWRISVFGGTYNITALTGLKTIPNYTPIYNRNLERSLYLDGLIERDNVHPYWMNLKTSNSRALSFYGVKFLVVDKEDLCVHPPWKNFSPNLDIKGWVRRRDLSWSGHEVWENSFYIGRSYLVNSEGNRYSGVKFLKDNPITVVLKVLCKNNGDRLVLSDLYYPGWQAFIDGKPVPTEIYHNCLRSVELDSGFHIVRWEYKGQIVQFGLILSICVLFFLVLFLTFISFFRYRE